MLESTYAWLKLVSANLLDLSLELRGFSLALFLDIFNFLPVKTFLFTHDPSLQLLICLLLLELSRFFPCLCLFHLLFDFFLVAHACLEFRWVDLIRSLCDVCAKTHG